MAENRFLNVLLAPLRNTRATSRFLLLLGAGCAAALAAFLALLNVTGTLRSLGSLPLPAHAYVDLLAIAFIAFAAPYGFLEWRETKRVAEIEERMPDFLSDLASLHKAGLTLMEAIRVASTGSYGALTKEIRQTAAQIQWGVPVLEALTLLRERLDTPMVNRTLTVVIEAGHAGGNVKDVLMVAAGIARQLAIMRRQRQQEMTLYLLIVYVASFVFLFVVLALQGVFVPRMVEAVRGIGAGGAAFGLGGIPDADAFRGLYITTAVVSSIGNGFVAGMMSDGRYEAGVKHAAVMVAISLAAFAMFG